MTGGAVPSEGGAKLAVDGRAHPTDPDAPSEYPALHARFAELLETRTSDTDLAPLRHVADAFMLGRRFALAPFEW